MKYALIALATLSLLSGAVVATGAVTGGDEAVDGVVLQPANTANGNAYAAMDGSGELTIELSRLNPSATTLLDSVFTATSTDDRVDLWIESESGAVSFYRTSDRQSIGSPANAVRLAPGETLDVGLRVETGGSSLGQVDYTVHAAIPQQGGGGDGGPPPGEVERETLTEEPPSTETPQDGGDGQPGGPGQVTATPTDARTPTPTDEPDREVGGLPLAPMVGLLVLLALLAAIFLAYRRLLGGPAVRIEAAGDGGLAVSSGALDPDLYEAAEGAVTLDLSGTEAWTEGEGEAVRLGDAAHVHNTTEAPLRITGTAEGAPEGLQTIAGDWGTDLLGGELTLGPGEGVDLSVRLPEDADLGGTATVRITADQA